MKNYTLYTDGAYQADVQIAGIGGYLIDPHGHCVFEFSEQIHDSRYFKFHESLALIHGLTKALEHGIDHLECFADDVSIRNVFNKETLSDISSNANPFRKDIFLLKQQFQSIQFHHLPRAFNKRADKLAGKILRIYYEDTLPNRTREHFIGQENKFLHIHHLVCQEDFQNNEPHDIQNELSEVHYFYFMDIFKNDITIDNIDDNNRITINLYLINTDQSHKKILHSTLLSSEQLIQKKLTTRGLEILLDAFQTFPFNSNHPHIGLMFNALEQPLQKIDMLLRRRGTLPLPDTVLTRAFYLASENFGKIVLHNDQYLIDMNKDFHKKLLKKSSLKI